MTIWDVLIIVFFVVNVGLLGYIVFTALQLKKPFATIAGRIKPVTAKAKILAVTGKRELGQNKDRFEALAVEVKGLAGAVRPAGGSRDPRLRITWRNVLTAFSALGTLRRGLGHLRTARNPVANAPGPQKAKRKTPPRTLGIIPDIVRLLLEIRKALRT